MLSSVCRAAILMPSLWAAHLAQGQPDPSVPFQNRMVSAFDAEDIKAGFMNKDRVPDLVGLSNDGSIVTACLNTGAALFQSLPVTTELDRPAQAWTVADIDGDSIDDIILIELESNSIAIYKTYEGGNIAFEQRIKTRETPFTLCADDIDNDGDIDIAFTESLDHRITVLLNDGTGFYTDSVTIDGVTVPRDIALADVDGDGDLDLAVTEPSSSSVVVIENRGDTGFQILGRYTYDDAPSLVLFAYTNPDSGPDIVTIYRESGTGANSVQIRTNIAGFFYGSPTQLGSNVTGYLNPYIVDLNNDGLDDLAITNSSYSDRDDHARKSLLTYISTQDAPLSEIDHIFTSDFRNSSAAFADFDLDDDMDIATASTAITLTMGTGNGNFERDAAEYSRDFGESPSLYVRDMNGDGFADVYFDSEKGWRFNLGNNTFTTSSPFTYMGYRSRIGDFDNDGRVDLAEWLSSNDNTYLNLRFSEPFALFATHVPVDHPYSSFPHIAECADLDNDGADEIILATGLEQNNQTSVMIYSTGGTRSAFISHHTLVPPYPRSFRFPDIDRDGDKDIIVVDQRKSSGLIRNTQGGFGSSQFPFMKVRDDSVFADINGDAAADIAVFVSRGEDYSPFLVTRLNLGDGRFGPERWTPIRLRGSKTEVADLDMNGCDDLIVRLGSYIKIFYFEKTGTPDHAAIYHCPKAIEHRVVDSDNDGDLDILFVTNDNYMGVLTNRSNDPVRCPPDLNNDGVIDKLDIARFYELGDVDYNRDGAFDKNDIDLFLEEAAQGCP